MPKNLGKIFSVILVLLFAGTFALKQKAVFGWAFDFLLVSISVVPLFLNLLEFTFFEIFMVWFLRALYPFAGPELSVLVLLPAIIFALKTFFPFQGWFSPLAVSAFGLAAFYWIFSWAGFPNFGIFFLNVSVSLGYSWLLYLFLSNIVKKQ